MTIKFNLETPKGSINLESPHLTIEQITTYAEGLGVMKEPKRPEVKPNPPSTPVQTYNPSELIKKASPTDSDTPDRLLPATYECPSCGNVGKRQVMPWFKFVKCQECDMKIYIALRDSSLSPTDSDAEYFGDKQFFTYAERQQHKAEQEKAYSNVDWEEDERYAPPEGFKPDIMDAVYAAAKKGQRALEDFDNMELKEYIERSGLKVKGGATKDDMSRVIYEDAKFRV